MPILTYYKLVSDFVKTFHSFTSNVFTDKDKNDAEDGKGKSPTPEDQTTTPKKQDTNGPPRRFISSILGGDVPYGSRGHVLTRADRKEYAPVVPPDKVVLPSSKKPQRQQTPSVPPVRCSVIQRTPKATKRDEDKDVRLPQQSTLAAQEPEQDQPIDYHIPKRRGEVEDENEERKSREQRRSQCSKISKPLISVRTVVGKLPVTMSAAAGHGRSGNGTQGSSGQNSVNSSGGGVTINFTGGSTGGNSGGTMGGGTGGGGMNPGRDGRQNYGPSSPPSGSLPPFYESLKGGNNGNTYNANGNFNNGYLVNGGAQQNMDCDTGQELSMNVNGNQSPPKQYSTLQNASYNLVMKDEVDLDIYETKIDPSLMQGSYSGYDDSMMVDMVTGAVVDPLQFTATLTLSSSAEHALLESLSDAADLSSFLQRLPNEDNDDEIIASDINSPSITPDSSHLHSVEQNVDSFSDHILNRNYENRFPHQQFSKLYPESLPSYPAINGESLHVQVQMHQQNMLSPSLSFNGSGLDLDSPTNMSLPSPGAASCSLDGGSHNDTGSPSNVSGRRDSSGSDSPSLQGRVNILQQRVSSKLIRAELPRAQNKTIGASVIWAPATATARENSCAKIKMCAFLSPPRSSLILRIAFSSWVCPPRCSWSSWTGVTASRTPWPTRRTSGRERGPKRRSKWRRLRRRTVRRNSVAAFVTRHSPSRDCSTGTWSVTRISRGTCAPSVGRVSTTRSTSRDTRERIQVQNLVIR